MLCMYVWKSECEYFECDFLYKVLASAPGYVAPRWRSLHSSCNTCSARQSQTKAACLTPPLGHLSCLSLVIVWRKLNKARTEAEQHFHSIPFLPSWPRSGLHPPDLRHRTSLHLTSTECEQYACCYAFHHHWAPIAFSVALCVCKLNVF